MDPKSMYALSYGVFMLATKDFTCPLCGHDAGDFEPVYE